MKQNAVWHLLLFCTLTVTTVTALCIIKLQLKAATYNIEYWYIFHILNLMYGTNNYQITQIKRTFSGSLTLIIISKNIVLKTECIAFQCRL